MYHRAVEGGSGLNDCPQMLGPSLWRLSPFSYTEKGVFATHREMILGYLGVTVSVTMSVLK